MKKIFYTLLALACLEPIFMVYAYNNYYNFEERRHVRYHPSLDCKKCCADHRFVSDECLKQCNQCQQYDDSSAAEGRDQPY